MVFSRQYDKARSFAMTLIEAMTVAGTDRHHNPCCSVKVLSREQLHGSGGLFEIPWFSRLYDKVRSFAMTLIAAMTIAGTDRHCSPR